jgi:Tol biopolymer transport system component
VEVRPPGGAASIWTYDLDRNVGSRFSFTNDLEATEPVWSPDGSMIAYGVTRSGFENLDVKPVGGSGAERQLLGGQVNYTPTQWTSHGNLLLGFRRSTSSPTWGIFTATMGDSVRALPVVESSFHAYQPALSPDGTLLAYGSTESGDGDIYVQAYPGPGGKWRISSQGGGEPKWRGDGKELFYMGSDRRIMSVTLEPGAPGKPPRFSLPTALFTAPVSRDFTVRNRYDVTKDGQKFLVVAVGSGAAVGPTTVVLDWLGRQQGR